MDTKTCKRIFELGLKTVLPEVFKACWSADTCNPDRQSAWSPSNPALGQNDVTAMVVRDLVGGEILQTTVNGSPHYLNRLMDGTEIDLMSAHLPPWVAVPAGKPLADPDELSISKEAKRLKTHDRYMLLSDAVFKAFEDIDEYIKDNTDIPMSKP